MEEHILLFQEDGAFCARNNRTLESFMHHAWIGAPWDPVDVKVADAVDGSKLHLLYGNGGMSIRSKTFMFDCIDKHHYQEDWKKSVLGQGLAEDIYFSRCFFEYRKDEVDLAEAKPFSSEEQYNADEPSLVIHDLCRVANGDATHTIGCNSLPHQAVTMRLLKSCPEAIRVINRCITCVDDNSTDYWGQL